MPDAPTPSRPGPISGYRSRPINAAVDFAAAIRPVAGAGIRITDAPAGKIIGLDAAAPGEAPRPWSVRAAIVPSPTDTSSVDSAVRVWLGPVVAASGAELSLAHEQPVDTSLELATYSASAVETDATTGLRSIVISPSSSNHSWLVAALSEHGWCLAWGDAPTSVEAATGRVLSCAIASARESIGPISSIRPLYPGVVSLGGRRYPMPFDIVNTDSGYAVYVGDSGAVAVNNTASAQCLSQIDNDGNVSLGANPSAAWLWVAYDTTYYQYVWGVSPTTPPYSYDRRYVARWQIGAISQGVVAQYWHGRIIIVDTECDETSIERGGDNHVLQLNDFSDGDTTAAALEDIAFLYRHPGSGDPGDPYYLRYLAGSDLAAEISSIATSQAEDSIHDFFERLLDATTTEGAAFAQFLTDRFQPLVSTASTTDGTDTGEYLGISRGMSGAAWIPHQP